MLYQPLRVFMKHLKLTSMLADTNFDQLSSKKVNQLLSIVEILLITKQGTQ